MLILSVTVDQDKTIHVQTEVIPFETSQRCERNIDYIKKQVKGDQVKVMCQAREIEKGK